MSTQRAQYILLGVKLPYDNDTYESYEADADDPRAPIRPALSTVYDGRDGRFIFIGKVLHRSFEDVLDGPIDLSAATQPLLHAILAQLITTTYGLSDPDIRLWFFTLYM